MSSLVCLGCKTTKCPCEGADDIVYIKSKNYLRPNEKPNTPIDSTMTATWLDDLVRTANNVKCPCLPPGGSIPPQA